MSVCEGLQESAVTAQHPQGRDDGCRGRPHATGLRRVGIRPVRRRCRARGGRPFPQAREQQLSLHGAGRRVDQELGLSGCRRIVAGHVDDAQEPAGLGVVHGRRGARPRLNEPVEVLRAADLDGSIQGERGSRRCRADRRL